MSGRFVPPEREEGAALLTVLLLVAVVGAIAAAALDRMRLSTGLAANFAALEQARGMSSGIEDLVLLTIDDMTARSPERTTLAGGWNGASRRYPVPGGGVAEARIRDGGNCFNLNSLVVGGRDGPAAARPAGLAQFTGLMHVLGIASDEAERIAAAAADWADTDDVPLPGGAEDSHYLRLPRPYRTGNTLFADANELRSVAGVSEDILARLRPWVCALPVAELSAINVNTLSPEQAPLIAMLAPDALPVETARRVIAGRPARGWANMLEFWRTEALSEIDVPLDVRLQVQSRTTWFALDIDLRLRGAELVETALVDARLQPSRLAMRRFGGDE
ncbi:MAG TPA: type II secretion system minor pseudopilin GspK [Allosphingosinicella sp.]|jgi:general secretion pathway protein K